MKGKVIKKGSDYVIVEVAPEEACTKCCSCKAATPQSLRLEGQKARDLFPGDSVEVEIEDKSSMLKVYFLLYGAPLAGFVLGIGGVYALTGSPLIAFLAGMFMTAIVYFIVGRLIKRCPSIVPELDVKSFK